MITIFSFWNKSRSFLILQIILAYCTRSVRRMPDILLKGHHKKERSHPTLAFARADLHGICKFIDAFKFVHYLVLSGCCLAGVQNIGLL